MKLYIKHDLKYMIFSKMLILLIFFLVFLFGLSIFVNYRKVMDINFIFSQELQSYRQNDLDIESEIKRGYTIISDKGNEFSVENPLPYYKESLETQVMNSNPVNTVDFLLAYSPIYFLFVFFLFGILLVNFDLKNKTLKIKTVTQSRTNYIWGKFCTAVFGSLIIFCAGLFLAFIANTLTYFIIIKNISSEFISIYPMSVNAKQLILQLMFGIFLSIFYSFLGVFFCTVFRSVIASFAFMTVYVLMPVLGKLDPSNVICFLCDKLFKSSDMITIHTLDKTPEWSFMVLPFIMISCVLLSAAVSSKRSSYL